MNAPPRLKEALAPISRMAGRRVNAALSRRGYRVTRARAAVAVAPTSMEAGLRRTAERGIPVGTVIDIGASDGRWSDLARPFFPSARFLLVEANGVHEPGLQAFKRRVPGSDYVLAAAGNSVGELHFESSDPFGGSASTAAGAHTWVVPATTIDHEVERLALPEPFLLKLDTHGFETAILAGAAATLPRTSLLIIEVYNFTLTPDTLRFYEMCQHLAPLGFRSIDLCDPMYRPKDGAFWQCDLFFARGDRVEFRSNEYR